MAKTIPLQLYLKLTEMFTENGLLKTMETRPQLTSAEKKELRGFAQQLKPHVYLGKQGLTETVLEEIDTALLKNGLIKVRFGTEHPVLQDHVTEISGKLDCECVGGVGKVGIFFREMSEEQIM